MAIGRDGSNFE